MTFRSIPNLDMIMIPKITRPVEGDMVHHRFGIQRIPNEQQNISHLACASCASSPNRSVG